MDVICRTVRSCVVTIEQQPAAAAATSSLPAFVPWAAIVAAAVAILLAFVRHTTEKRDRRRSLYSDAFAEAMRWVELTWRVRRRATVDAPELVAAGHDIQERINYFSSWLALESPELCRSYCTFVDAVKGRALPMLRTAWAEPVRPPSAGAAGLSDPRDPEAEQRFLNDVRDHLSFRPRKRRAVKARNPATSNTSRPPATAAQPEQEERP